MEVDEVVKAGIRLFDLVCKSNPESLRVGIGNSMPVITQEALAPWRSGS